MEVCSNFSSIKDMHKEADAVIKKATLDELKTLISGPDKGAMSVYILCWAMNQADSGDARQRARWAKYKEYTHPHDHCIVAYFTTRTMVEVEEEQEAVVMEVEE